VVLRTDHPAGAAVRLVKFERDALPAAATSSRILARGATRPRGALGTATVDAAGSAVLRRRSEVDADFSAPGESGPTVGSSSKTRVTSGDEDEEGEERD